MNSNSMKSVLQSEAAAAPPLFDDWFDPIEAGLRGRVREFIQTMIEAELEAALSRLGFERLAPDVLRISPLRKSISELGCGDAVSFGSSERRWPGSEFGTEGRLAVGQCEIVTGNWATQQRERRRRSPGQALENAAARTSLVLFTENARKDDDETLVSNYSTPIDAVRCAGRPPRHPIGADFWHDGTF